MFSNANKDSDIIEIFKSKMIKFKDLFEFKNYDKLDTNKINGFRVPFTIFLRGKYKQTNAAKEKEHHGFINKYVTKWIDNYDKCVGVMFKVSSVICVNQVILIFKL